MYRDRLTALEQAAAALPDPSAKIRIVCDPTFFGDNPRNPLRDLPAHECPAMIREGDACPVCDEFFRTHPDLVPKPTDPTPVLSASQGSPAL